MNKNFKIVLETNDYFGRKVQVIKIVKALSLFILLIITSRNCISQDTLDYGVVKADTNFYTEKQFQYQHFISIEKRDFYDFDLPSIIQSKNELEIRFSTISLLGGSTSLIIFTYNNHKWNVTKFTREKYGGDAIQIAKTTIQIPLQEEFIFDRTYKAILDTLKANKIFQLPYPYELNPEDPHVHDGAIFDITYKVKNNFRHYSFSNPDSYAEANPTITEFKEYRKIVHVLNTLLR